MIISAHSNKSSRSLNKAMVISLCLICCALSGCENKNREQQTEIAVTNTYLASAVGDVAGGDVEVFCLAPPGMCPGHFDMSPEQLRRLLDSRVLFRFDFQAGMDDKLKRTQTPIVSVQGQPGMCIPQTYLRTCRQILPSLAEHASFSQTTAEENLQQLEIRLNTLAESLKSQIERSGLAGTKVLASGHQAAFAEWLGLEVVGTFQGVDGMTPTDIEACLQAGQTHNVSIVIANLQEGTDLPKRIADHLNGSLVVFSNFPDTQNHPDNAFEYLLQSNVDNLIRQPEP